MKDVSFFAGEKHGEALPFPSQRATMSAWQKMTPRCGSYFSRVKPRGREEAACISKWKQDSCENRRRSTSLYGRGAFGAILRMVTRMAFAVRVFGWPLLLQAVGVASVKEVFYFEANGKISRR
ncbi:hypothetical protein [uncultured Selenomonas sp.]|uniref:hypothetical protein n=1 Tax=uncultured Selenomonas sp. TaxID=159275 RepID=UPI0025DFD31C|nr:hypothetical protein [uncultured Selenomonas sp.]